MSIMEPNTFHHSENADVYHSNASFVFNDENTRAVLQLLDPRPGDRILDVGCGSGELTLKLHKIVTDGGTANGMVVGVDVSTDMLRAAEAHSNASGLRYALCDGHDLHDWLSRQNLSGTFDKVFSSAALHWMKNEPEKVVQGIRAALKPDGVLAIEMGGHMNCLAVRSTLHAALRRQNIDPIAVDPWYFPTAEAYSKILVKHGFDVKTAYLHPRPTKLPQGKGLIGWLRVSGGADRHRLIGLRSYPIRPSQALSSMPYRARWSARMSCKSYRSS
jgi:ubiquinone/menaquinone biosynthesis C-methylase UbiE